MKSKPSSKERFFLGTANPKRAAAHGGLGPERAVAAYRRTPEREQTLLVGWPSDIGRDQLAGSDSALGLAVQQQTCSSPQIQPSTWLRIASLHLAETSRPTALPHGSALHLQITCKLLLCVRLGISVTCSMSLRDTVVLPVDRVVG